MLIGLVLAAEIAAAPQQSLWAEIWIDDTRGSKIVIDVFQPVARVAIDPNTAAVTVRRTETFANLPPKITWTGSGDCPGLRQSLDAIEKVALRDFTIAETMKGPAGPPPLHRPTAKVVINSATLPIVEGSELGAWLQGVLDTSSRCWKPGRPKD
ncbi:hypothetical protein [Phenylobacterium sp.]|uniref:hypothetical protein n=1 Tax=Phenylobacterium sp. TaxID=1871053 RepID=UPI0030F46CE2